MKMLIISDTHSSMDMIERIIEAESLDGDIAAVIHPGDIGIYDEHSFSRIPERERRLIEKHRDPIDSFFPYMAGEKQLRYPVYAIPGNHEDFSLVDDLCRGRRSVRNLRILTPESGAVIQLIEKRIKIMGLGKILPRNMSKNRSANEKYIQDGELTAFTEKAMEFRPDVMLFHEPPLLGRVTARGGISPFGSREITNIIKEIKPALVLCGHMHFEYRIDMDNTVIIGMGYGAKGRFGVLFEDMNFQWKGIDGAEGVRTDVEIVEENYTEYTKPKKPKTPQIALPVSGAEIINYYGLDDLDYEERKQFGLYFRNLKIRISRGENITRDDALAIAEKFLKENGLI